jgi:hypothetical protein
MALHEQRLQFVAATISPELEIGVSQEIVMTF